MNVLPSSITRPSRTAPSASEAAATLTQPTTPSALTHNTDSTHLSLPISGRPHSKIIQLQPSANAHEYTATLHDGFVARPMRLVAANPNLTAAISQAHGQAYEMLDANGQAFLFLGQRPGLRGGAPERQPLNRAQWQARMQAWAANPENGDIKNLQIALERLVKAVNNDDNWLYLDGLAIKKLDAATFDQLNQLQSLFLESNQFTVFPAGLSQLNQLQSLDLRRNKISVIPESLSQFSRLERLYLTGNKISVIPASLSKLTKLKWLYLSSNQISVIPESLSKLTKLEWLYLSSNQISVIPESLSKLTQLQRLNLSSNQISVFDRLTLRQLKAKLGFTLYIDNLPEGNPERREALSARIGQGAFENLEIDHAFSASTSCRLTGKAFAQITRPVVFAGQLYELSALMDHWLETGSSPSHSGTQLPLANFFTGADRLKKAISVSEPEYLVASLQNNPPAQAQAISLENATHLPEATAVVAITPPLQSDAAVQVILQGLHNPNTVQQLTAQADAILAQDQPAFEAAIQFFGRNGAAGLESLLAQRNEIERACTLVIDVPAELRNQPAALVDYYRAFNNAFDQLYISARVTGSGLFTLQSRAAAQVNKAKTAANGLQTMASYLPDALQKMAVAMPFPASAVAAVMASAWIYQRDTGVFNSLNAFADLMTPHISEHNLIAKQLATNICLQRQSELLALAASTAPRSQLASISASVDKIKNFAVKHNLARSNHWQSPMALTALADLNRLQKGVLQTSMEQEGHYEQLRTANTADKTDYLLSLLGLQPAHIQLPDERKPAAIVSAVATTGVSHHDLRKLAGQLSQAEEKLASVEGVARQAQRSAAVTEKKVTNIENRFDLLAPESLHPLPVAAGRQAYLAAQATTEQHATAPAWLSTSPRQQASFEQEIASAFTDTTVRLENVHAENRELKHSLSQQEQRQAKLKTELEQTKAEAQAQIQAQQQKTADLERQVQEMRAFVARQAQLNTPPTNPANNTANNPAADGCCVIQ